MYAGALLCDFNKCFFITSVLNVKEARRDICLTSPISADSFPNVYSAMALQYINC
jgi:hypothetical protein